MLPLVDVSLLWKRLSGEGQLTRPYQTLHYVAFLTGLFMENDIFVLFL